MGCTGQACDFDREYGIKCSPVLLAIERAMLGSDYGGTSWTTLAQAQATAAALLLAPGKALLEIGAGSGWPGLAMAQTSGCDAMLTDPSQPGLRQARTRAERDGLSGRVRTVAASGVALPFPDASFDAVHHADVLCCMDAKRELLHECRRVARSGARMAFTVIVLAQRPVDEEDAFLLRRSGPQFPDAGRDYAELLAGTGWEVEQRIDVTNEFVRCMDVQLRETEARRAELLEVLGAGDYGDRRERRLATRAAVERGLLRRESFVAR